MGSTVHQIHTIHNSMPMWCIPRQIVPVRRGGGEWIPKPLVLLNQTLTSIYFVDSAFFFRPHLFLFFIFAIHEVTSAKLNPISKAPERFACGVFVPQERQGVPPHRHLRRWPPPLVDRRCGLGSSKAGSCTQ